MNVCDIFPNGEMTKSQAVDIMLKEGLVSDTLLGRAKAEIIFQFGVEGRDNSSGGGEAYEFKAVKNSTGEKRYRLYGRAFTDS